MDERIAILSKYNFWNRNVPETGFPRRDYTDKIMDYLNTTLVKVLVGQRRVGKSYILRQIALQLIGNDIPPENIFYINKEFIEYDFMVTYKELEETVNAYKAYFKPKGKFYLFIDEIQMIKGWEHFVNSYSQNFADPCEIFITGSNSEMLSGELATLLSGRYVKFEIFPFSYAEYLGITKRQKSRQSYTEYMETGALPELFMLPNEESKRNYVSAIKDTILLRDIIQRYNIKDAKLLEDVFIYLVNNASNLISVTNILNYFESKKRKTSYDTLSNYISYLEQSFLIHKVERFSIKGKEVLSGIYKYYINDLSFKNYLYPGFDYGVGYKLENLLFLELKRKGYMVYIGTFRDKEIDFVAKKGDKMIYIQCCYMLTDEKVIAREYSPLQTIKDNYDKYVVTMDEVKFSSKEGIEHIQVWNFSDIIH
jgi:predicted AAA+ superfamily ATPase